MGPPITPKFRLPTPRKTTSSYSSAQRWGSRSSKPHIHVSLRRSFGDKVGVSATVEESGIKFNNMFTVDDQRHTKSTIAACVTPHTELTFLEPKAFPPDEAPALTETNTHLGADFHVSNPSHGTQSTPQRPPNAEDYRAPGSGSVPFDDPRGAYLVTSRPSGHTPWPLAYPLPRHDVDAESRSSLGGCATPPPEHVVETAYLAPRTLDSSGSMSPPTIPSALGYDRYRYSEKSPSIGGYATNHWDSRFSHMQHTPSQPSAIAGGWSFAPRPLMYDAGGLSPGAPDESGVQFRGGGCNYLHVHSAVWPSGDIPGHKQIKTLDNETAQGARFGIVQGQTCSCGRNAHEHVGYLCESETTNTPWGHASAYTYYQPPSNHIWQEQRVPEGPVPMGSTASWDGYWYYAPAQDVGNTQMAQGLDPRLAGYYNHDLPRAYTNGAANQPAFVEGLNTISPHASGSIQLCWETADTSAGPSYQGVSSTWY